MAGNISFLGISGDNKMNEYVDALVKIRRDAQIDPMEDWKAVWEAKLDSIDEVDTALSAFYTTVSGMDEISEFLEHTATSSNASVLTATADSEASTGSYSLTVGTDVKHRLGSEGKADQDTTIYAGAGSEMTITVGSGSAVTVLFGLDMTLQEMADAINASGAEVTAEVIDDGSSTNQYRLALTADIGGSDNLVVVSGNTTNVDFDMSAAGERIDDAEEQSGWSGTSGAITTGGQYTGNTNKTFSFTIGGSGSQTVGTDSFSVSWNDGEGNSGTFTVSDGSANTVFQGVEVSFANGSTMEAGDSFTVDVWNPDLQAGQDEGVAKAERETHSGFSDTDATAVTDTSQTFSYTYNGQSRTLTVAGGTTLSGLVNLINQDAENPGVKASIVNDGSGLSTAYHLVLSGTDTGAAHRISDITSNLTNFGATFTETQKAQNAMLKLDGFPAGDVYIQKSTNTVTDVIEGVTLSLVSAGTATLSVGTDTGAIIEKVEAFKEAFNNVRQAIADQTFYDSDTGDRGLLQGNYALQIIKSKLDGIMISSAPGFVDGPDPYVNMQQLGFSTDVDDGSETKGLLLLDTDELETALETDPEAVARLFSAMLDGRTDNSLISFSSALDTATPGVYDVELDMDGVPPQGRFRLEGGDWGSWYDLSGTSGNYTLTATDGPEKGIALHVGYASGTGTQTTTLGLRSGVAQEMSQTLEEMLSESSGILNTLTSNYNDIIDNIDTRIAAEERRLKQYEDMLIDRFARLDTLMSDLNSVSSTIQSYSS